MLTRNKPYQFYVLDLDWLNTEAMEVYAWKVVPFHALVELLLFSTEEQYLEQLLRVHLKLCSYKFFSPPPKDTEEALKDYWSERRLFVLYRLEQWLDVGDIEGAVAYYKWLPCNHLIVKKVEKCYTPPPDHLVSESLF